MKVKLENTFHRTTVNVVGEKVADNLVRISERSKRRAQRTLCGIKHCLCSNYGPYFEPDSNPHQSQTTWVVLGEPIHPSVEMAK